MRRALELAARGGCEVSPNPQVGACVVRQGRLTGEGWHRRFGGPHAEVDALRKAGARARGAVLYVTLEPCSSWGKTPPCTEALIRSGIREVIYASADPNPRHAGKARLLLRRAGISVRTGLLRREAEHQNEVFYKWMQTGMPFLTLKMAQTLDGKIATRTGQSRWISSPASRTLVQKLRQSHDGVLVGKNTWRRDNPELTVREGKKAGKKPVRIVLDPDAELPANAALFRSPAPLILAVAQDKLAKAARRKWPLSVTLVPLPRLGSKLNVKVLLQKLGSLEISSLLVEGGGETAWSFLSQKLVDRIVWIVAPKFFGGRNAVTSLEGEGVLLPDQAFQLRSAEAFACGSDLVIEGRF